MKKKIKIPQGHHIQSPELISIQTERDDVHRDMLKYKEQVVQYQDQIEKYKENITLIEKEKIELEDFKNTTKSTQSVPSETSSEDLVKSMASLQLKDKEIEKLKGSLDEKMLRSILSKVQ